MSPLRIDTVYTDDANAWIERQVTDNSGGDLTWAPLVAVDSGDYDITAEWRGDVGSTRVLRVPLVGLEPGTHDIYLQNPNGPDWPLGQVIATRR